MNTLPHPTEDELILHFFGEGSRPAVVQAHLALCDACREQFEAIAATMALAAAPDGPARGDLYGLEVWQRIRPQLPPRDFWSRIRHPRWSTVAAGAAVAACAAAAFVAGRSWPAPSVSPAPSAPIVATEGDAQARALASALVEHLDRSERVLVDLANADGPGADVSREQAWAADLVDANRLYRDAAAQTGDAATALVLDDLERTLLDIVHAPSPLTAAALDDVRTRLDAAALLFKVRILSSELREREAMPLANRKTI
jgi:hypothetical protein